MERKALVALSVVFCALLSGCGTPGTPQPPSLNLADTVADLAAVRTGNKVALTWTMPRRNTDKTAIKGDAATRICRREGSGSCDPVGGDVMVAPGQDASYTDALPLALTSGAARPVVYLVELRNKKGRSAGLSNAATVLAGDAPRQIEGLKAEVRKRGVLLNWIAQGGNDPVRLERTLLSPAASDAQHGPLAPPRESAREMLIVDSGVEKGQAFDETTRFGERYAYRAQRVRRLDVDGKMLEITGEFSQPIDVDVTDVFPPSVPAALAAVATAGGSGGTAIDLSWQPDTDAGLAGYIVYRREGDGEWQRISSGASTVVPAFHDAEVQAGHTYRYAVSAMSKNGHESSRSDEAKETVPQP